MRRNGRRGNGRLRFTAAALVTLPLVACGGQATVSGSQHTIYVHGGSLLPRGGEDALIQGTLATRNGCVVLAQGESDVAYPVIWPSGTSIAGEAPLTLRLPSGVPLTLGQAVVGSGGYHDATSDRVTVDIPSECLPPTDEVAVFNPDDDPSRAG
jgi:hypothetical protein